jgi:hypothetical protein
MLGRISYRKSKGGKISYVKIAGHASIAVLVCVMLALLFPDAFINKFIKGRITQAFEKAYPAYSMRIADVHYRIRENRLECDSVRIMKTDSTFACRITRLTVSGVNRMQFLWGGGVAADKLESSHAEAQDIVLTFMKSQYELRCTSLQISVPDSVLVIERLELHPLVDDEQFFAGSKFRRTRCNFVIPQCRVAGLDYLGLLQRKNYRARTAQIYDASLSVLVNKDKPVNDNSPNPSMPNVIFSSIKEPMQIDSIGLKNGHLNYNERFGVGLKPAVLTCDSMQVMVGGIGNTTDRGDTVIIRAQGILMGTGVMSARISMPVASPKLSFRYSGFLNGMNLSRFNQFIEISENKRLKTGILHKAEFDIDVTDGKASGIVRAEYENLKIAAIENLTGSESGVVNKLVSFLGNNLKLRTTNMPDKSGSIKIGEVKYERKSEETFLEFAWFALRSGIINVVGF